MGRRRKSIREGGWGEERGREDGEKENNNKGRRNKKKIGGGGWGEEIIRESFEY